MSGNSGDMAVEVQLIQSMSARVRGTLISRVLRVVVPALVMIAVLLPSVSSAQEAGSTSTPVYFEETGQVLSGAFLDAWFEVGGPDQTGLPVSPPAKMGDKWVQWFEYSRLEVAAESYSQANAEAVTTSDIGRFYAGGMGYMQAHSAFRAVSGAGDGAVFFEETGHSLANAFLESYETSANDERLGMPISEEFSLNGTTYQFFERGAMSWSAATGAVLVPVGTLDAMRLGRLGSRADMPDTADVYSPSLFAQRSQFPGERWIEVNLSTYTLTAWVGETPVMSTLVVTGAPISPTVAGEFQVYWKLDSQTMAGVGADGIAYEQPDVPDVMYFFEDWAIHGAYWRSGFGYAASHGCVNVPLQQAQWLYDWATVGTRVVVHA